MKKDERTEGTIIYLVCWPITPREVDHWGLGYLSSEGFDVQVLDLTYLLRKEAILRNPVEAKIRDSYVHEISSYKELFAILNNIPDNTIFIDYIVSILDITYQTSRLFRMLRKSKIRYCVVYSGTVPFGINANEASPITIKLIEKIKKLFNLSLLKDYISGRINRFLVKHTNIYPKPERIFTTIESEAMQYYLKKYPDMKDRLVPVNAHDYDKYLEFIHNGHQTDILEQTCVFLDEGATHNSDYAILGLEPLNSEDYYNSMNRLFDDIESKTGLTVIIAAHPKSKYEEMPEVFKGRKILKGKTLELVSQSSMVVMHSSTSVSFAVLCNKPIMLVKTQEMISIGWYAGHVDTMAKTLGLPSYNIDNIKLLKSLDYDYSKWDKTQYDNYIHKYITSDASAGHTTVEILARELKDMLSMQKK